MMTIRTLQIFVAVAEEGSMHAAAKRLFIAQPTVSQAIAELEKTYEVRLFERLSHKLYITETGKKLLAQTYHLLDTYNGIEELLKDQGKHRILRIGSSVSVGTCMLNDIVEKMQNQYARTELSVRIDNTSVIEKMLLENQLDVALVEGLIVNEELICKKICEDELIIVAAPFHPLANKKEIEIEDLEGQEFLSREDGSNDRNQFEQFLQNHAIHVKRTWISSNTQAIKNGVLRGRGLAILSKMMVAEELKCKKLVQIMPKGINIQRNIKFVYHKDKYMSEAFKQLAECCGIIL